MESIILEASETATTSALQPSTHNGLLWAILEKTCKMVFNFDPNTFQFHADIPGAKWRAIIISLILYYAMIFGGREYMRDKKPLQLKLLFQIHNLAMSIISLVLFGLIMEQIIPAVVKNGFYFAICAKENYTVSLTFLYYLNYICKYVELADTLFLILKKKPLQFLHCYHHGATVFLCFTQLKGSTTCSFGPIALNLFVHIIMYYYYYLSARGIRVWWKKSVTIIQITQFVIDLVLVYLATYSHYVFKHFPNLPCYGDCSGSEEAALFGCFILSSYLFLFIGFYIDTYSKKKKLAQRKVLPNKFEDKVEESLTLRSNLKHRTVKT